MCRRRKSAAAAELGDAGGARAWNALGPEARRRRHPLGAPVSLRVRGARQGNCRRDQSNRRSARWTRLASAVRTLGAMGQFDPGTTVGAPGPFALSLPASDARCRDEPRTRRKSRARADERAERDRGQREPQQSGTRQRLRGAPPPLGLVSRHSNAILALNANIEADSRTPNTLTISVDAPSFDSDAPRGKMTEIQPFLAVWRAGTAAATIGRTCFRTSQLVKDPAMNMHVGNKLLGSFPTIPSARSGSPSPSMPISTWNVPRTSRS